MKEYMITIDGGTTNTRCILWDSKKKKIDEEKRAVGVRNTAIDGNNGKLKQAVKECLESLLANNSLQYDDIQKIIASGMITSDVGIVEIPHLTAPAGLEEMAGAMVKTEFEDICPMPIHCIPGIKNAVNDVGLDNYEAMDIMRGEETESIAVIDKYFQNKPMLLILPGSHNKFVGVDSKGRITGCLTSISGELLAAVTNNTILAKSVGSRYVEKSAYDKTWVLRGYENARKTGLGRACFSGRILNLFVEGNTDKIANYILGACLQGDIMAIQNSDAIRADQNTEIVVCGKEPLQQALIDILRFEGGFGSIKSCDMGEESPAAALGACIVAEKNEALRRL